MCGITYGEILTAAKLSESVYRSAAQNRQDAAALGYSNVVQIRSGGTFVSVCRSADVTWVVFRGTQLNEWEDINADRKFLPASWFRGLVHRGFRGAFLAVWPELKSVLASAGGRIICTGHSLGGALALLAGDQIGSERRTLLVDKPDVITFGCPLVGSWDFNRHLSWVTNDVVRVTNGNDPIPWLFAWPLYQHPASARLHLTGDGDVLIQPTRWELFKRLECGRAKSVVQFLQHYLKTRSLFRSWLRVTSVLDHMVVRYRRQLEAIFEGRQHEFLE